MCNVSARRTAKSRSQRVAANVCFTVLVRTRRGSSARGGVGHALKLLCGVGALDLAVLRRVLTRHGVRNRAVDGVACESPVLN